MTDNSVANKSKQIKHLKTMEEQSIEDLEKEFDLIKMKFSEHTSSDESILIKEMQDNLKQRTVKKSIVTLDDKTRSLDSDVPSDLFAIDSKLKYARKSADNEKNTNMTREKMLEENKYRPNHPYWDK